MEITVQFDSMAYFFCRLLFPGPDSLLIVILFIVPHKNIGVITMQTKGSVGSCNSKSLPNTLY